MIKFNPRKFKKVVLMVLSMFLIFSFYYTISPGTSIGENYGPVFLNIVNGLFVAVESILGMVLLDTLYDIYLDDIYRKEENWYEVIKEDPKALAIFSMAKSIRMVGFALIIAASILIVGSPLISQ